ncbi:MAG: hypothetical protein ACI9WU_002801, partial [Myxococcota bacterium]
AGSWLFGRRRTQPTWRFVVGGAAIGLALWGVRALNFATPDPPPVNLSALSAGQYTGRSQDFLRSVHVRAVVREGGHLIFAEAHSLPFFGLDRETLYHEPHRALFFQGVPPAAADSSDPETARLVHFALAQALSGEESPEEPRVPEGARVEGGVDSYWAMFPNEFDHRCDVSKVPDGAWRGTSSSPRWSIEVEIEVLGGVLRDVRVVQKWSSGYGAKAFAEMPGQMVQNNAVDVDLVSGATRSSLLIRSAAYHACAAALASGPATTQ